MEVAFLHQVLLSFAPMSTADGWGVGLLARDGQGLFAAQLLHAGITIVAALGVGRAASDAVLRVLGGSRLMSDAPGMAASLAGALAAGLVAWTPWSVVVGSLAYNEMVLVLMGGALCVLLLSMHVGLIARWVLSAVLVGGACGAKPTAILFLGVPVLLALVLMMRAERPAGGPRAIACGLVVGLLMLAPWLVRNTVSTGNPVFPFAASIFSNAQGGTGPWSAEQVSRFQAAHSFAGPLSERLATAILSRPDPGNPSVQQHRGLMHPQWGWLFPMTGLAILGILPRWRGMGSAGRGVVGLMGAALGLQLMMWLFATHVQARFLMPLLPVCALLVAVCVGIVDAQNMRSAAALVLVGAQALFAYNVFARESQGAPLGAITAGPAALSAEAVARVRASGRDPGISEDQLGPVQWMNLALPPDASVLMVGDATPLYARGKVRYATTWDTNPLATLIQQHPQDAERWSLGLREQGIDFVLLNLAEIQRYERSGFLDPRLAPASLKPWIEQHTVATRAWPQAGSFLLVPLTPQDRERVRAQQGTQPSPPAPATPPSPKAPDPR
jgi:hypothetical protein